MNHITLFFKPQKNLPKPILVGNLLETCSLNNEQNLKSIFENNIVGVKKITTLKNKLSAQFDWLAYPWYNSRLKYPNKTSVIQFDTPERSLASCGFPAAGIRITPVANWNWATATLQIQFSCTSTTIKITA